MGQTSICSQTFKGKKFGLSRKEKRLIDTILREWSIPPVHFVVTPDNRLEVLDGQQRLASIRDFLHDQFSIDANISPFDETLQPLHGRFYSQLDQATRRKIDNYPLRGFRITEYQPEEPNELFLPSESANKPNRRRAT
jgi:hypothetical protein